MKKMIEKIKAQVEVSGVALRESCSPVLLEDHVKRELARRIADQLLDEDILPILNTREHKHTSDSDIFGVEVCVVDDALYRLIRSIGDYRFWSMLSQVNAVRLNKWMLDELQMQRYRPDTNLPVDQIYSQKKHSL